MGREEDVVAFHSRDFMPCGRGFVFSCDFLLGKTRHLMLCMWFCTADCYDTGLTCVLLLHTSSQSSCKQQGTSCFWFLLILLVPYYCMYLIWDIKTCSLMLYPSVFHDMLCTQVISDLEKLLFWLEFLGNQGFWKAAVADLVSLGS